LCDQQYIPGRSAPSGSPASWVSESACDLCGLPVGRLETREGTLKFCCPGCRQVFLILSRASGELPHDFRESTLFLACLEAGIISGGKTATTSPAEAGTEGPESAFLELDFRVKGMWCPACAWIISEVLKRTPGVVEPRVSFFSDAVRLKYLPHRVSPAEIVSRVEGLGYRVDSREVDGATNTAKKDLLIRLGISSILTMNVMMLSCLIYYGFVRDLTPTVIAYFSYPLFAMTLPVVFYGGMPIFRRAWTGLRYGVTSMDTLISMSALAAFFYSLIRMIQGSIHLYFDTAAMLITIVLLGRYIESRAREQVMGAVEPFKTGLEKVRLVAENVERWVDADAARPGDLFIVQEGERIPLDGLILEGEALLDQSVLTGESAPVVRGRDEPVMAGSLLVEGRLEIRATRASGQSALRQMTELMAQALERKSHGEALSDVASRYFVPTILCVAVITAGILWASGGSPDQILLRCLTILFVSCPCTLGIAVPLVKVVIVGLARKKGVLIARPEALERVTDLDTIVFDKTGTLTEGSVTLRRVVLKGRDEKEILSAIGAIESQSSHFLAREIRRHLHDLGVLIKEGTEIEESEGMGVTGTVEGARIFAGNRRLLSRYGVDLPLSLEHEASMVEEEGMTVVFVGRDKSAEGFLTFGDPLKQGAREAVDLLQRRGIKVLLISGDGYKTTEAVAGSLGIADFVGQALPAEKAQSIRDLQSQGRKVGMVGDGANDAGALAQAEVGFAMGSGYAGAGEVSDLIILSGRPELIAEVFTLSSLSKRMVRQNLSFAFLYNAVAIPVAALGLLNPLIAVSAMWASSLTVIGNGLRIGRKGAEDSAPEGRQHENSWFGMKKKHPKVLRGAIQ
jgi:heavy metal translocating P-type ATPase